MSDDLGKRVCEWVLRCRREPGTPPPEGLFDELWRVALAEPVLRHRLPTDPYGTSWAKASCREAFVASFLQDEIVRLPEVDLTAGIPTGLLICKAEHWVWREHARRDPLGARVYQAMGSAVRALLATGEGGARLAPGSTDATKWLPDGSLAGDGGDAVTAEDLTNLLHLGGWRADLLHGGSALRRWIGRWLTALPSLWGRGPWPGCSLRLVLDALLAQARADAPKGHSVEAEAWVLEVADSGAQESTMTLARGAFMEWFTREVFAHGSVRPEFARRFLRAVRTEVRKRTNQPRSRRCSLLAVWMLTRLRDQVIAGVAALPAEMTDDERRDAAGQVAREVLHHVHEDWPPELELAFDFFTPRFMRGLFPAVERVQQTGDRAVVREAMLLQLQRARP